MLHEIILALSGHPSPLLRPDDHTGSSGGAAITPPERELLASVARLSDLHIKLLSSTAQIASHPSIICRAVATAIESTHLAAFQRKVLDVEESILRKDAGLVGAYDIVPLTAVVGEFSGWTRRLEWLWDIAQFMLRRGRAADGTTPACTGARIIDRLRGELQTGYVDVEKTARSLVRAAEMAWVKQVSAWILYGRLPHFGGDDFFIQTTDDGDEEYTSISTLLPSFVTTPTVASMLFIGRSLNQIRSKANATSGLQAADHLSSQLKELSQLTYPLDSASFSRTITNIRLFLSRTTLQKLLPLSKVVEMLQLLRDFFLLGRGEFAVVLTQQADEQIRGRWRRADNLAYEKRDGLGNVVVKEGEVAAVLSRTWSALGSMQGQHSEEDEGLELAWDLLRLQLAKATRAATPLKLGANAISSTPFRNLLFSVPVVLTLQVPSPLDLFLTSSDLATYTSINSYLLSIRRAHIRLTDLWKITSLRRHHPPPPGPPHGSSRSGRTRVCTLRERHITRSDAMRSAWATCSAAVFFLAETEGYLQAEVVAGLWDGFQRWLTADIDPQRQQGQHPKSTKTPSTPIQPAEVPEHDDIWLAAAASGMDMSPSSRQSEHGHHDPQTLAAAHRLYLRTLTRSLLLTRQSFTDTLYKLLVHIDGLVALIHRLHGIWTSQDLEADVGVVDAFVDLERDELDVGREIKAVKEHVRKGVESAVAELRALEGDGDVLAHDGSGEGLEMDELGMSLREAGHYVPRRVGGVDRLLMKLEFGTWVGSSTDRGEASDDDEL